MHLDITTLFSTAAAIIIVGWSFLRRPAPQAALDPENREVMAQYQEQQQPPQPVGREEPLEPPLEEPLEEPLEPTIEQPEAPELLHPARLDWMRDHDDVLVDHVIANRGIDQDWRHLHDAAKAGREHVVSRMCNELQISALLVNKRGRNILHAAIDHKRYRFVIWLASSMHNTEELGLPKQLDFDQVLALFAAPDATGRVPFLSAAVRRDTASINAMARVLPGLSRGSRLGPPTTKREEFIEVCELLADDVDTHRFLLHELRAFDVCWELRAKRRTNELRASFEAAPWWPPNLDEVPWSREEAMSLYWCLLDSVASGQVDQVAWLLDQLHVSPNPPLGMHWQGHHLGDFALIVEKYGVSPTSIGELEQTEMAKDAAAAEYEYSLSTRRDLRSARNIVLSRWDGLSSESLAHAADKYLSDIHRHGINEELRFRNEAGSEELAKWIHHVAARKLRSDETTLDDVGSGGSVEVLQMLTDRLGVKGAPRLQMIALTGSAWALRWLIESNLVSLDAPLRGEERLPSLDEGGDENCCICFEGMLSPVQLPCAHKVCRKCIRDWFKIRTSCPMCRAVVEAPQDVQTLPQNLVFALADDLDQHAPWLPAVQRASSSSPASLVSVGHVLAALAAYRGALTVLEFLRDAGTDLTLTFDGLNLMHIACMNAQPHIVRWLIQGGHAPMALALSHERKRPLQYACESGDNCSFEFLLHLPSNLVQREARAAENAQDELSWLEQQFASMQDPASSRNIATLQAAETNLTTAQLAAINEELLAEKRSEVEEAARLVESTRATLAAAQAQAEPLAAAAEGWLEAASASPYERISNKAKEHLADLAAEEALTVTLPRLLAQGAQLSEIVEIAPQLERSRIGLSAGYRAPARERNPWLQVVRRITEHGRADVLRWFYSERRILSHIFEFKMPVDDRLFEPASEGETYEGFGRKLASQCNEASRSALIQVYDDLIASKAASSAWFDANHGVKDVFGFTKESYHNRQLPDFPEPAIEDVLAAASRMDSAFAMFPDGMRPDYMRSGQELLAFDPADSTVERGGLSAFLFGGRTCRNLVAIKGYLKIARWFVEVHGSTVEQVMRMLYLAVRYLPEEGAYDNRADVQAYLLQWLLAQGADIAGARFHDDDYDDRPRDVSRRLDSRSSLLDVAVRNAIVIVPLYSRVKEPLSTSVERCWSCVELLQRHVPECPMRYVHNYLSDISTRSERDQTAEWWAERDDNVKRFLRFAEARGIDLSGSSITLSGEHVSIAQLLTNGTWMGCVRWLSEERGVDLQHIRFDRTVCLVPTDRIGSAKEELLRLQRAQRQRHAARGR